MRQDEAVLRTDLLTWRTQDGLALEILRLDSFGLRIETKIHDPSQPGRILTANFDVFWGFDDGRNLREAARFEFHDKLSGFFGRTCPAHEVVNIL